MNDANMAIYTKEKFTEQEVRMGVKLLNAVLDEDPEKRAEVIAYLKESKENFIYNVDAVLKGLDLTPREKDLDGVEEQA